TRKELHASPTRRSSDLGLSRNGRRGEPIAGRAGALARLGGKDVTVAGIVAFSFYSLTFNKSFNSLMNSPRSRKCLYTDANRTYRSEEHTSELQSLRHLV